MHIDRIKKRKDFLRIAGKGNKAAARSVVIQAAPAIQEGETLPEAEDSCRVGFTVTRKMGNAVVRNRIKRRLRAAANKVIAEKATPAHEYVLIGRYPAYYTPFSVLLQDMHYVLRRLGLSRKK